MASRNGSAGRSIRDAFMTSSVKSKVIEIEANAKLIGPRIRELKTLAYQTMPPAVYHRNKDKFREIGKAGGFEFSNALVTLKYAWASREDHARAQKLFA